MTSEAQRRATAAYRKKHVKQLVMKFYPGEEDLYDFIKSQPKINAYLKELVRKDMQKGIEAETSTTNSSAQE